MSECDTLHSVCMCWRVCDQNGTQTVMRVRACVRACVRARVLACMHVLVTPVSILIGATLHRNFASADRLLVVIIFQT